jgi:feruloyl esterase
VVFSDPKWDWRTLDLDKDVACADKVAGGLMNAIDPDLTKFFSHGGKLLLYHGWTDQGVAPQNSINYYNQVLKTVGDAKAKGSICLFLVPGMGHCAGGEGCDTFDKIGAMEQWRENNKIPERIVASHLAEDKVTRTRPLCAYPQVAQYGGSGNVDEAENFVCTNTQAGRK